MADAPPNDNSARWVQTQLSEPLFHYPRDGPRAFTASDLLTILQISKGSDTDQKKKKSKRREPSAWDDPSMANIKAALHGKGGDRTRMIVHWWPRDPKGKYITPENTVAGKMAPNDLELWGSTLLDFYRVRRIPDLPNLQTISTGSKLMGWMKENGEDFAKDEIVFAELEDNPKLIRPWSPQDAIEEMEEKIRQGEAGKLTRGKGKAPATESTSTFDYSNYPSPWPLIPFSYPTEQLTSYIDHASLPRKLVVHDPWNLLEVDAHKSMRRLALESGDVTNWTNKPDRTINFKLRPYDGLRRYPIGYDGSRTAPPMRTIPQPPSVINNITEGAEMLDWFYLNPPTAPGPVPPPIIVAHPFPPPKTTDDPPEFPPAIDEAHLYIWPSLLAGRGNHSFVHRAELELPRSVVIPEPSDYVLCRQCVEHDINQKLKDMDGENGERMHPRWKEKSAVVVRAYDGRPPFKMNVVHHNDLGDSDPDTYEFTHETVTESHLEYKGPFRLIETSVEWQDRMHPTCDHLSPPPPVPPTVKLSVIAKLSIQDDDHLAREAQSYQQFPRHVFQHWSGYNVFPPIQDPVPVAPVVPQFYGYYVPEEVVTTKKTTSTDQDKEDIVMAETDAPMSERDVPMDEDPPEDVGKSEDIPADEDHSAGAGDDEDNERDYAHEYEDHNEPPKDVNYLSPILLLEDCGEQVEHSSLTTDQKNEATSLMFRFHYANWVHGSVYPRNFLIQPGPLTVPPAERSEATPSFRLVDFGRSQREEIKPGETKDSFWIAQRMNEEKVIQEMFGLSPWE